jgi:signal transduction histidine kinase
MRPERLDRMFVPMRRVIGAFTWTDVGLAAVAVGWLTLATWWPAHAAGSPITGPQWLRIAYPLLVGAPLAWRRRYPLTALSVTLGAIALQAMVTFNSPEGLFLIYTMSLAAFSVSIFSPRPRAAAGLAILIVSYLLYALGDAAVRRGAQDNLWATAFFLAMLVGWWFLGGYVRNRREERRAAERAKQLEEQARTAVDQERARLARELHDVISHNLSVVVVQAAGARAVGVGDPATLEKIERSGRESLVEMRRLLGVLRREHEDDPRTAPQPGIAQLDALIHGVRAAGVDVEYQVDGDVAGLPAVLDLCAYRIVQESLTNVVKHAGPARATVTVRCDRRAITIDVLDDGVVPASTGVGGHGLVGMRERVAMFGGELTTGPRAGGGFAVHARLPWDGEAA